MLPTDICGRQEKGNCINESLISVHCVRVNIWKYFDHNDITSTGYLSGRIFPLPPTFRSLKKTVLIGEKWLFWNHREQDDGFVIGQVFASSWNKHFTLAILPWITVTALSKYLHQIFKKRKELHHYRLLLNIVYQPKIFESNVIFTQYWALDSTMKLQKFKKMPVWWMRKFGKSCLMQNFFLSHLQQFFQFLWVYKILPYNQPTENL